MIPLLLRAALTSGFSLTAFFMSSFSASGSGVMWGFGFGYRDSGAAGGVPRVGCMLVCLSRNRLHTLKQNWYARPAARSFVFSVTTGAYLVTHLHRRRQRSAVEKG